MVRVIKSHYLNTPQLLDVDRSKVHILSETFSMSKRDRLHCQEIYNFIQKILTQTPFRSGPPQLARVNQEERLQINLEINEMLRKGAIQQVESEPGDFLSNLFLVNKKDGGHRPEINLKFLNSFMLYRHFKM